MRAPAGSWLCLWRCGAGNGQWRAAGRAAQPPARPPARPLTRPPSRPPPRYPVRSAAQALGSGRSGPAGAEPARARGQRAVAARAAPLWRSAARGWLASTRKLSRASHGPGPDALTAASVPCAGVHYVTELSRPRAGTCRPLSRGQPLSTASTSGVGRSPCGWDRALIRSDPCRLRPELWRGPPVRVRP